jgi:hypothetical protein
MSMGGMNGRKDALLALVKRKGSKKVDEKGG